jgi:carbamoyltransferase
MYILGINGGFRQGYQDVSAVITKDGKVLAAIEEERLSRIKFSAGKLPYLSILKVLEIADISIKDIDMVAFHGSTWQPNFEPKT